MSTSIRCATWIKQEQTVAILIPGNMAMPEHHHARPRKLLPCHLHPIMRIPQDMHNADAAISHHDFALNGQFQHHLFLLDVALDGCHRRYGFQFRNYCKDSMTQFIRQNIL